VSPHKSVTAPPYTFFDFSTRNFGNVAALAYSPMHARREPCFGREAVKNRLFTAPVQALSHPTEGPKSMNAYLVGLIVFACTTAGIGIGGALRHSVPGHHVESEGKETIKVSVGMIATLTALMLGLLVASAKESYDTKNSEFRKSCADLILLDRVLKHYGDEAKPPRATLKRMVTALLALTDGRGGTAAWNSIDVFNPATMDKNGCKNGRSTSARTSQNRDGC
jgi:NADH:ubiquinone oxidoreductase subunit 5 (subunit L)/multisubunit Na+/H+ antiporter MnhA subunit